MIRSERPLSPFLERAGSRLPKHPGSADAPSKARTPRISRIVVAQRLPRHECLACLTGAISPAGDCALKADRGVRLRPKPTRSITRHSAPYPGQAAPALGEFGRSLGPDAASRRTRRSGVTCRARRHGRPRSATGNWSASWGHDCRSGDAPEPPFGAPQCRTHSARSLSRAPSPGASKKRSTASCGHSRTRVIGRSGLSGLRSDISRSAATGH